MKLLTIIKEKIEKLLGLQKVPVRTKKEQSQKNHTKTIQRWWR